MIEGHGSLPRLYRTDDDPDLDVNGADPDDDVVADARQVWRAAVEHGHAGHADLLRECIDGRTGQ